MSPVVSYGPSTIWRFELPISDVETVLKMPRGSSLLHGGVDKRTPAQHVSLWALIALDGQGEPLEARDRTFRVFGTGHPIPDKLEHIASVFDQERGGWFVWHVFEASERAEAECYALDRMRAKIERGGPHAD